MATVGNVLFIMRDPLRADHLSCYGPPAGRAQSRFVENVDVLPTILEALRIDAPLRAP